MPVARLSIIIPEWKHHLSRNLVYCTPCPNAQGLEQHKSTVFLITEFSSLPSPQLLKIWTLNVELSEELNMISASGLLIIKLRRLALNIHKLSSKRLTQDFKKRSESSQCLMKEKRIHWVFLLLGSKDQQRNFFPCFIFISKIKNIFLGLDFFTHL